MQDHHRKLIEKEAENWRQDARLSGTVRTVAMYQNLDESLFVGLSERKGSATRITQVTFPPDVMPLTARMVRARFADPFAEAK